MTSQFKLIIKIILFSLLCSFTLHAQSNTHYHGNKACNHEHDPDTSTHFRRSQQSNNNHQYSQQKEKEDLNEEERKERQKKDPRKIIEERKGLFE